MGKIAEKQEKSTVSAIFLFIFLPCMEGLGFPNYGQKDHKMFLQKALCAGIHAMQLGNPFCTDCVCVFLSVGFSSVREKGIFLTYRWSLFTCSGASLLTIR